MTTTDLQRQQDTDPDPANLALVGDVGGTNARFALVDPFRDPTRLISPISLRCGDYSTPQLAIADFMERVGLAKPPSFAVIAAAGPVSDGAIHMTNLDWTLSEADLRSQGFASARLVNDYAAAAFAAPLLDFHDAPCLGGPANAAEAETETIAVLGAGTGFGVSALARDAFGECALSTEGGHVAFAPCDDMEMDILRRLRQRFGRVSVERILSGAGISLLHQVLGEIEGDPREPEPAAAITAAALEGEAKALATVRRFCAILGSVAGDMALAFGARGGVFVSGGIAPAILAVLQASDFRARFEDKGRFADYMRAIPTRVVLRPHAALLGAADLLRRELRASTGARQETPV
jgi:glucokinase